MTVINTGSVSLSYDGDRRAAYLLLDDFRPEIRRVEYDVEQEIKALNARDFPHADWIARTLRQRVQSVLETGAFFLVSKLVPGNTLFSMSAMVRRPVDTNPTRQRGRKVRIGEEETSDCGTHNSSGWQRCQEIHLAYASGWFRLVPELCWGARKNVDRELVRCLSTWFAF